MEQDNPKRTKMIYNVVFLVSAHIFYFFGGMEIGALMQNDVAMITGLEIIVFLLGVGGAAQFYFLPRVLKEVDSEVKTN